MNAYNETRCTVRMKPGWYCRRGFHMTGPCALVPKWWNFKGQRMMR